VARQEGQDRLRALRIEQTLDSRYELNMTEYDELLRTNHAVRFGTRNTVVDQDTVPKARVALDREVLFLKQINEFHREYEWTS
jgi:polyketide biosynthesis 3-hydroxy-3-methylglutaryl-CoA synthase-like enzyme PksG